MGAYVQKYRTMAHDTVTSTMKWWGGNTTTQTSPNWDMEQIITRGNPWRWNRSNPVPNAGGHLYKKLIKVDLNPFYVSDYHTVNGYQVGTEGWCVAAYGQDSAWTANPKVWANYDWVPMEARGATAISRCAPTNSHADLAVSLAELKSEGLPKSSLITAAHRGHAVPAKLADEHLGVQFGLLPFISDVTDTVNAVRNSGRILEQYARDAGKLVRRSYEFPEEKSTSVSTYPSLVYPLGMNGYSVRKGFYVRTSTTTSRRTWFSGAFTYASLAGKDAGTFAQMGDKARELNHLLGLRIAPDTVWNLVPWSWLVDWKTNIGDVLHNVSMFQTDGLVLVYGYVMQMDTTIKMTTMDGGELWNRPGTYVNAHPVTVETVIKMRRAANPFGFGIDPGSFSNRQWSILAALGLSKGSAHTLKYNPV